jgi:AMP nucleosidase
MNKEFEAAGIVDQLAAIYEESVANLRAALAAYIRDRSRPDPAARAQGCFGYP